MLRTFSASGLSGPAVLQLCRSGLICWANAPCVIGFRIRTGSHPSGGWLVSAFFLVVPGRRGVARRAKSASRSRHGVALGSAVGSEGELPASTGAVSQQRPGTGSSGDQAPDTRKPAFSLVLGSLAHDRRLRSDPYDPQRPGVRKRAGGEGRSTPLLHSWLPLFFA
jgi:hypothetical protein